MHDVGVAEGYDEGEQRGQGKVAVHHHQGERYHLQGGETGLDSSSLQFTAITWIYAELILISVLYQLL